MAVRSLAANVMSLAIASMAVRSLAANVMSLAIAVGSGSDRVLLLEDLYRRNCWHQKIVPLAVR
jgi:hypothetical protein